MATSFDNYLGVISSAYGNPAAKTGTPAPGAADITGQTIGGLNTAFGGVNQFTDLSGQASGYLGQLLSGGRTSAQDSALRQRQAQQSVGSGMPNTQNISGTLLGNSALRDERDFAGAQQAKGFQGLLDMLGSYAGTVTPTAGQNLGALTADKDRAQRESQFGRELAQSGQQFQQSLSLSERKLAADIAQANAAMGLDVMKLTQQASQFQQTFGLEEKRLAQQLGLSEKELALRMAELNANNEYRKSQLNQGQQGLDLRQQEILNQQNQFGLQFNNLSAAQKQAADQSEKARIASLVSSSYAPKGTLDSYLQELGLAPGYNSLYPVNSNFLP